jgi:hypothetical protein
VTQQTLREIEILGYNPRLEPPAVEELFSGVRRMKSVFTSKNSLLGNRRKFERVDVDYSSQVYITDDKGKRAGILRQIGRGGFMVEPEKEFKDGKKYKLTIVDRSENIKLNVKAIVRYSDMRRVGFEFDDLSVDSAVEIGILIGKYYQTDSVIL